MYTHNFLAVVGLGPLHEMPTFLRECVEANLGNVTMVPFLDTLHDVPWAGKDKYKVGSILCETKRLDGSPQAACPRYVSPSVPRF